MVESSGKEQALKRFEVKGREKRKSIQGGNSRWPCWRLGVLSRKAIVFEHRKEED